MNPTGKSLKLYLYILPGIFAGLCFPLIFIFLDLKQLGLIANFSNMYEVFKSQNIYLFSTILFPLLFGLIGGLYFRTFFQNKQLAQQESYIKSILNSLIDCILVCDSSGKIQYANNIFYNLYETNSNSLVDLLGIKNLKEVVGGQFFELCLTNKNGVRRSVNYIVYKINDNKSGSFNNDSYIVSIRDIDDLKKNEEIIESQKNQIFEASKFSALGQMASGFAHEINNPLAIINGKLALIERDLKKEEVNEEAILRNLDICKKTVMRITRIIAGLRNLSHTDLGDLEKITIKNLFDDAFEMAKLKMIGSGIDFRINLNSLENEEIVCNPVQISQVLMNVMGNAIDAIEGSADSWLSFSLESIGNEFKIIIMDSGKGIPIEVQAKMFDPMFTTKAVGKGTGLGLSISRAIIEKHHGKMLINNSKPNTCFEIILPKNLSLSKVA
jgi:signal transduction histidine kinase